MELCFFDVWLLHNWFARIIAHVWPKLGLSWGQRETTIGCASSSKFWNPHVMRDSNPVFMWSCQLVMFKIQILWSCEDADNQNNVGSQQWRSWMDCNRRITSCVLTLKRSILQIPIGLRDRLVKSHLTNLSLINRDLFSQFFYSMSHFYHYCYQELIQKNSIFGR